jgi:predicted transcriptional regulator of viral defense system
MPRRGATETTPDWDALYERAAACAGHFDVADAHSAGFSNQLLRYYVGNGRLERPARGIYRLARFPASEHEDLVVIWLWSGREGVFSHETALALHDLSDVMPAVHHLTVPSSFSRRLRVPKSVELHYADLDGAARAWMGPVPVTSPARTLTDCAAASVSPDLVEQAVAQAVRRGLVSKSEAAALLDEHR